HSCGGVGRRVQISYGKGTVTMQELATIQTSSYSRMALAAYLGEGFAYLDSLKASFASSSSFSSKSKAKAKSMSKSSELSTPLVPPDLPRNESSRSQYALSNIIRTDGVHLQLLAFDTSKP
ncbi:hypothetical protein BGX23_002491, partial [Mortierella sp. AD031]